MVFAKRKCKPGDASQNNATEPAAVAEIVFQTVRVCRPGGREQWLSRKCNAKQPAAGAEFCLTMWAGHM